MNIPTIAGVPDLGRFNSETIEPMDFSIWRAVDGSSARARHLSDGRSALFDEGGKIFTRDPMVARYGSEFFLYYTAVIAGVGAIFCRTSANLIDWSESQVVSRGGAGGSGPADAECAFGYRRDGAYYLLRWHSDGDTSIYRSDDPFK